MANLPLLIPLSARQESLLGVRLVKHGLQTLGKMSKRDVLPSSQRELVPCYLRSSSAGRLVIVLCLYKSSLVRLVAYEELLLYTVFVYIWQTAYTDIPTATVLS